MSSGAFFSGTALSLLSTSALGVAGAVTGVGQILEGDYAKGCMLAGACGLLGVGCLRNYLARYETSEPNEWMLVIEDGEQSRASVGLRHFRTLMQTCVRFPSSMQDVTFEAEQVTKEVQGVRIKGFATWTIFRNEDGPYRAYRTFDGLSPAGQQMANNQLGKLTESILRNMVSNLTIQEVLTQRDLLRKNAKEQLLDITKGWGIWIETVEITDVRISSGSLFSNLQAEFRQKTRLEAEQIKMSTEKELTDARRINEVEMQESRELADTRKFEIQQGQQIAREQRKFQSQQEQHKIKLQQMEQNKEYNLNRTRTDNEVNEANELASQSLATIKQDYTLETTRKKKEHDRAMKELDLAVENNLTPNNMKVRMLKHSR